MFLEASSLRRFNSSEQHFAPIQMTFPKMLFPTTNPKIRSCCFFSQPLTLILWCQTQSVSWFVCHGFPLESRDSAKCPAACSGQLKKKLFFSAQTLMWGKLPWPDQDRQKVRQGWHFQNHTPLSEMYNQNLEQQNKGNCLSTRGGHTEIKA